MSDLSPEARAILDAGIDVDEPSTADRNRVRRAIAARIGVGIAAGAAVGTAATKAGAGLVGGASTAAASASVGAGAAGVGAAGVGFGAAGAGAGAGVGAAAGAAAGGGTGAVVAATGVGAKALFSSVAAKLVVGIAVAGGGGAAIYELQSQARWPSAPRVEVQAPNVPMKPVETKGATRLPSSTPTDQANALENTAPAEVVPTAPAIVTEARALGPVGPVNAVPNVQSAQPGPPTKPREPVNPVAIGPAEPASTLSAEAKLLQQANEALQSGRSALALERLSEHERSFPNGLLAEERTSQRVIALCAEGRDREAKGAARGFVSRFPKSPYIARIEGSCAGSSPR